MKKLILGIIIYSVLLQAKEIPVSVVLTVFNKQHQIKKIVEGIIANTHSPFEFVIVFDGCTDKSEEIARTYLDEHRGNMVKLTILYAPDVNETRANNIGLRASQGKYVIILQDDMYMKTKGWDKHLIKPMELYPDVFAVSARWAGSYKPFTINPRGQQYLHQVRGKDASKLFIRDCVCRGPIAFDRAVLKQLNFFDEIYAPLYMDDHDLCIRAYRDLKKVCGYRYVPYAQLKKTAHPNVVMSTGELYKTVIRKNRIAFWTRYKDYFSSTNHDENRSLEG